MALSKERIALIDACIALGRKKGYHDEELEVLLMLTIADQTKERVGSSEKATERLLEFIKECDSPQKCLTKMSELAGL